MTAYTLERAPDGGFYVTEARGELPLICGDLETCLIYVAQKLTDPQPQKRKASK